MYLRNCRFCSATGDHPLETPCEPRDPSTFVCGKLLARTDCRSLDTIPMADEWMMKLSEAEPGAAPRRVSTWSSQSTSRDSGRHAVEPLSKATPKWTRWISVMLILIGVVIVVVLSRGLMDRGPVPDAPTNTAIPSTYDPQRAIGYLTQLCNLGPRPSGTPAMRRQQEILQQFFTDRGATVTMQTFEVRHPEDGSAVPMANLIASWYPQRPKRFLLCAHYDTRPYPDSDPRNKRGVFVGANDGASGTAALMELAHRMTDLPTDVGVDVVLFDGEEFVWQQGRDDYFLGSKFFAEKYRASPPSVPYQAGILLDMIGDRELKIYYEKNSLQYARSLVKSVWRTADRLGVRAFVPRSRHRIEDDHLALNRTAEIPTIDLIDFDYPRPGIGAPSYWHTEQDIPANCSGESIAAVVWVVHEWLKEQ